MAEVKTPILNRFVSLGAAIDMLERKKIALLSPETWDDRNDRRFMALYRQHRGCERIFALCGSMSRIEQYHHWKVFAGTPDGICITFDRRKLRRAVASQTVGNWRQGKVAYLRLSELDPEAAVSPDDLPFRKRAAFRDEGEYRIIVESNDPAQAIMYLDFSIDWIEKITLAPWMPQGISESVKTVLSSIDGGGNLKISRSTLLENQRWMRFGDQTIENIKLAPQRRKAVTAKTPNVEAQAS